MSKLSVESIKGNGIVRQVKRAKTAYKIEQRKVIKECGLAIAGTEIAKFVIAKFIPGGKISKAMLEGIGLLPTTYAYARYDSAKELKKLYQDLEKTDAYQEVLKRHVAKTLKENFGYLTQK